MDPAILIVSFKSASKIRLVRWPALFETRASRSLANYTVRWAADRSRLASGLPITHSPVSAVVYAAAAGGLSTVRPASL